MTIMPGLLIAFEGLDRVGKKTQMNLLSTRLLSAGKRCETLSFPRYEESFYAELVGRYLNGEFGDPLSINPYLSSLPYALDRLQAKPNLDRLLGEGVIVLIDRYVGSNLAHQGVKVSQEDWPKFRDWLLSLEYEVNNLPKDDLTLFLLLPPQIAYSRAPQAARRSYTRLQRDAHESDLLYQTAVGDLFMDLANSFPSWRMVNCVSSAGTLLSEAEIGDLVFAEVTKSLAI